jgi:hypothetical protein
MIADDHNALTVLARTARLNEAVDTRRRRKSQTLVKKVRSNRAVLDIDSLTFPG